MTALRDFPPAFGTALDLISTTFHAFVQAMGLIDDHAEGGVIRDRAAAARVAFAPPRWKMPAAEGSAPCADAHQIGRDAAHPRRRAKACGIKRQRHHRAEAEDAWAAVVQRVHLVHRAHMGRPAGGE